MESERLVAGMRCSEVLADLSDYLDGGLAPDRREHLEAHVRGCDYCERFGREFSSAVRVLREQLGGAGPIDRGIAPRLRERLRRERG